MNTKNRPSILKLSLLALMLQLLGAWIATGVIVNKGTWLLIVVGFLLIFIPIITIFNVESIEQPLSLSDRRFWVIVEISKLIIVAAIIAIFDIEPLKLFWSAP